MNLDYKYNLDWAKQRAQSNDRVKYVFFWGHQEKHGVVTKSCFSQWYPSRFELDGRSYATAEHWMMAEKAKLFGDMDVYEEVFLNAKPGAAKACGRKVRNFVPQVWDKEKYKIVVEGNLHKFNQSAPLTEFLISTGDRMIVEASPVDPIWGIGLAQDVKNIENPEIWRGQNLLGFALMEVRDLIREQKV